MRKMTIVTLGPGSQDHLTLAGLNALTSGAYVVLRTGRHGVAEELKRREIPYETLDALYDGAEDFDTLNERAVDSLLAATATHASVCYGVADPTSDATVFLLRTRLAQERIPLLVVPGVTQAVQTACEALGAVRVACAPGLLTIAAGDFDRGDLNPGWPLVLTELHSRLTASEIKLLLLAVYPPETPVLFRHGTKAGVLALEDIDRQPRYDHTASLYVPALSFGERRRYTFADLVDIMDLLRAPEGGCPWDREQTHETLRQYLIEEAYEAVDAVDQGDMDRLADELGDVLLQVVFHACVGRQQGTFDILDVTSAICHKMITRHAHIFGDIQCATSADVLKSWEAIKKQEKGLKTQADAMVDIPRSLPALMYASKVQNKAKQVGFDWDDAVAALAKVREETVEAATDLQNGADATGELGDLLFAAVNVSRLAGIQPELALKQATDKFIRRFTAMERAIVAEGKQLKGMTLAQMDVYWDKVKAGEQ